MVDALFQFAGRLHPMVLHLPIGLLVGLLVLEIAAIRRNFDFSHHARGGLALLLAISAVAAAATGWLLSRETDYGGDTLTRHFWLGIGAAILSVFCAVLAQFARFRRLYAGVLPVTAVVIAAAGHLGAEITHGRDWLWAPFRASRPADTAARELSHSEEVGASAYMRIIAPIFEARCVECHGESKKKARLALHCHEAILAGSGNGPVIDRENPDQSELLRRLRLPLDDEERMPPPDHPQLTEEQILAIESWILSGTAP